MMSDQTMLKSGWVIDRIRENRNNKTSFTDNDNGETVKITRKGGRSQSAPKIDFIDTTTRPENGNIPAIEKFISDNHKEGFRFSLNSNKVIELRLNVNKSNNNNITFKPLNIRNNERGKEKIVLKRDSKGIFQYNDAVNAQVAVDQFKELINDIIEEQTEREKTVRKMPMVDTESNKLEWENEFDTIDPKVIPGLTPKEVTELCGVLFSSKSVDPKDGIGPDGMLQKQIDYISETIWYTERELDRTSDPSLRQTLEERIYGLNDLGN